MQIHARACVCVCWCVRPRENAGGEKDVDESEMSFHLQSLSDETGEDKFQPSVAATPMLLTFRQTALGRQSTLVSGRVCGHAGVGTQQEGLNAAGLTPTIIKHRGSTRF